jgi:GR25 family glycosyltransferase involved in LPS biosynthesis
MVPIVKGQQAAQIGGVHGLYINLDRSPVRRSKVEAEIARIGLADRYRRIRGVVAPEPYNGCSLSHIKAMQEAAKIGGIVHIIEDDVLLSGRLEPFLRSDQLAQLLETYDIVYLSMWVDPKPEAVRLFLNALPQSGERAVLDMHGPRIGAMDSYVVAPRSIGRVVELMTSQMTKSKVLYNDAFINTMVKYGRLKAATVVPFLTCIDLDTGTRSALQTLERDEQRMLVRLRTSFFVDRERQDSMGPGELAAIAR